MSAEIFSVVFDCNIFIQSLLNPVCNAARCLEIVRDGKANLYVSSDTLAEITEVLLRPNIISRLPDANAYHLEAFIEDILDNSDLVSQVPKSFTFRRDPKDEIIINLAICTGSDYIVSRDNDLLDLMTGFSDDCKEFRQRFRDLKIVEPEPFLEIVENRNLQTPL